jgi:ribonuclease P protein component
LARAGEIRQVAREGKRIRTAHCDVRVNASLLHPGRVGIVVPKHGHRIVDRNRLRRRISELVRTELLKHVGGADVLIRALPEAYGATFEALRDEVRGLRRRFSAAGGNG